MPKSAVGSRRPATLLKGRTSGEAARRRTRDKLHTLPPSGEGSAHRRHPHRPHGLCRRPAPAATCAGKGGWGMAAARVRFHPEPPGRTTRGALEEKGFFSSNISIFYMHNIRDSQYKQGKIGETWWDRSRETRRSSCKEERRSQERRGRAPRCGDCSDREMCGTVSALLL
jgi:hypothetical protein